MEHRFNHFRAHVQVQPFLAFAQPVLLKAVGTAEIAVISRQDYWSYTASGNDSPVYAAHQLKIGQLIFPGLAGDMSPQKKLFLQGQGKFIKIPGFYLVGIFFLQDIQCTIKAIEQNSPIFYLFFFLIDKRKKKLVCAYSQFLPVSPYCTVILFMFCLCKENI